RVPRRASYAPACSSPVAREPVARTPDGLDRLATERPVHLVAQVADVDLHDVRVALEVAVPDRVQDLPLRHHVAPVPGEEGQDRKLTRGQADLDLTAADTASGGVDDAVAELDRRRPLPRPAPGHRAQAGDEDGERERLGQVVVGA